MSSLHIFAGIEQFRDQVVCTPCSKKANPLLFLQYLWLLLNDFNITLFFFTIVIEMIGARIWNKIYHLILTALHYPTKVMHVLSVPGTPNG